MDNAGEFLDYYNKIEKFLKEKEGFTSFDSFSQKLKNSKNSAVKKFKDELISLGNYGMQLFIIQRSVASLSLNLM
jgi:hypothetical protein